MISEAPSVLANSRIRHRERRPEGAVMPGTAAPRDSAVIDQSGGASECL